MAVEASKHLGANHADERHVECVGKTVLRVPVQHDAITATLP